MPNDPLTELLEPQTPRKRVHSVASRAGISPDIADDYLKVTNVESGHNVNVRDSPKGAQGFGQVMPDVKGGSTRTVGGRRYNLRDPEQNIEAGLRYFAEGGGDPVARRLHYFGGPRARQKYERTGRIPNISDGNMTAAQYVQATGGRRQQQKDPLSELLGSEQIQPPTSQTTATVPTKPRRGQQSAPKTIEEALTNIMRSTNQVTGLLKQQAARPQRQQPHITVPPNAGIGELRRLDDPEAQRITRIQQEVAAKDPMSARLLPARVARRAAQQASREREDELKAQANEPRLRDLTDIYRKEIQKAKGLGIGPEQWLNEAAAKGAAGLTELIGGGVRGLSPVTALVGELTGTRTQVADNIKLHAQAMQRAAEEEGADRNRVSKAIQNVVGGTIASAPEMAMISAGAPPMAAFGLGGASRSVGRGERPVEVAKAGAHGVATGGAFQLPLPPIANPLARVATRAGTTGLATGGLEASQGAPLDQAIEAGITNALMAGAGEISHIRREPSALERGLAREIPREPIEPNAEIAARLRGTSEPQIQTKPPVEAQREAVEPVERAVPGEIQPRNVEMGGRTGEEIPASATQRFYHRDFGEVIKTESQEGARAGRTRVQEVNDPEKIHYVKTAQLTGAGNQRMVPVKSTGERLVTGERADISLSQFVRKQGGIVPAEMFKGELDRLRKKETGTTGLINQNARQGNLKQTADIMMQAANDAGFRDKNGQPFENPGDFIRAVERDVAGEKTYSTLRDMDAEFEKAQAQYYKDQQAAFDADAARTEFLESGRGAELLDKIIDRKATDAERTEYLRLAEERGISRAESEDLIAAAREEIGSLQETGTQRPTTPTEQLGFVQEGLTQESAAPSRLPDQRARLLREEQDRQASINPERTAAQAKLEEIRRRGMTVEDYARQPDLEGKVPDPNELKLLRELESGTEPEPTRQRRLGEEGVLRLGGRSGYTPATTPVLKEVERATMSKPERPSVRSVGRRVVSEVQRRLIAEFTPLRELETTLYGKDKVPVVNMARKFEQVAGAPAKAQADIFEFKKNVVEPIKRSADDFNSYLFLKRVEDRLLNDPDRKRVADWTVEKAQAGLNELKAKVGAETYKQLERAGDAYQKEMDKALRLQVESGRMSEELYTAIKESNDFYAPFKVLRYVEDTDFLRGSGRRVATTQELSKKISGIDSEDFQLGNILQTSAEQIVRSRILAEKNLKMLELDKLADVDPKGELIKRVEGDERPRQGYEFVRFLKDGKPVTLEVTRDVANAVQGLNPKQAGLLTQAMMIARRPLQVGATSANAGFQAVNLLFADLPRSALVSRYGLRNPKDIVQFPLDWSYSLFSSMKGNYGKPNKLYMEFLRSGAANSTIQRSLTPEAFRPTLGIAKPGVRHLARSVIDSVAKFSNAIEETSKVLGIKRGMRIEQIEKLPPAERQAALEKIVTEVRNYSGSPDFARKGADTRDLNLLFMFFNARLQGITADLTRLSGKTGTKEATTAWARLSVAIGIPTTLLALVNHQPGNKEDYDKIPDWEKKTYWMIPRDSYFTTEDGEKVRDYWRIPKRELGQLFGNTIEAAVDFGMKRDPKAAKDWSVDMLENLSPINVQGKTAGERLESAFASTNPALKLPAEALMNRDTFRHRDIVPEYMKGAEPSEQYRVTTPRPYVKAGQATGVSPLQLEHAAEGLTGSALGQFSIRPPLPGRSSLSQYPVFRRFFRSGAIAEDTGARDRVSAFERQETTVQVKRRREAIETLQSLRGLSDQEIASRIKELKSKDPKLAEKVEDMRDEVKKGITYLDKKIKMLGVESGAREAFIEGELASKSPEERAAYLDELKRKGLLPKRMRSRTDRPSRAPRVARQ